MGDSPLSEITMMDAAAEEIVRSYDNFDENKRLDDPYGTLQRLHTQEILSRYLATTGLEILDVGGATGAYAFWLSDVVITSISSTSRRGISSRPSAEMIASAPFVAAWSAMHANSRFQASQLTRLFYMALCITSSRFLSEIASGQRQGEFYDRAV